MSLIDGARTAVNLCMGVKSRESVLIVTDSAKKEIGEALYRAALEKTDYSVLTLMPETEENGGEPVKIVREAMVNSDVIFITTKYSLTHTKARRLATKSGARIASMPGITNDMMSTGGITADFREIKKTIKKLSSNIKSGKEVKITTELGTNLSFSINRRKWITEDIGICRKKGSYTNLPAGEIFIAPVEGTAKGKLVVDGSFMKKLDEPVTVDVDAGFAQKLHGKDSVFVEEFIKAAAKKRRKGKYAYNLAKFGFGMNPKSKIIGNILEDEKVKGTIHIGFGGNYTFGGRTRAGVNVEGIVTRPTVAVDGNVTMENGKFEK